MNIQPLDIFEAEDLIKYEMFGLSNATMVPVMITMTPAGITPLTPQPASSASIGNQSVTVSTPSVASIGNPILNTLTGTSMETQYDASTNTISNNLGSLVSNFNDQTLTQTAPSSTASTPLQLQQQQQIHQFHTLQLHPPGNTTPLGVQPQLIPPGSIIVPASQTAKLTPEQLQQLELAAANGLIGSGIVYQTLPLPAITPPQQQPPPIFSTTQQSQLTQTPVESQQFIDEQSQEQQQHCHILQTQQQQNNISTATKITQTTKPVTTKNAATITTATMTILEDENENEDEDDGEADDLDDDDNDDDDMESNHGNDSYTTSCIPKNFSMNGRNNNNFVTNFGRITAGDFFSSQYEPGCNVGCNALMIMGIGSSSSSGNRNGNIEMNGNTLLTNRNRRQSQQQQLQQQQQQYSELQRQSSIIGNPIGNLLDNNIVTSGICSNGIGSDIIGDDNGTYKNETNNTNNDQVKQQLPCNCTYMSFDNFTDYQIVRPLVYSYTLTKRIAYLQVASLLATKPNQPTISRAPVDTNNDEIIKKENKFKLIMMVKVSFRYSITTLADQNYVYVRKLEIKAIDLHTVAIFDYICLFEDISIFEPDLVQQQQNS
ncbi:probable serine/threonine-protein kinase fhkB [Condylostylus longicornis]|uniref:probable serine/threonine-protein kinase fhkB n=1 Tax=Condylostylus longicornis TaxID=2530218 RepID=UPI00244DAAB3|nr:probable serine/threonine-protein kinase fhkB [Condylostylus longicornis]